MTGAEHYREAEELLAYIAEGALRDGITLSEEAATGIAARAQAHATLALAAAQAMPTVVQMMGDDDQVTRWSRAIGWLNGRLLENPS